jgi:thiol-disulfide isomerase/thioredoxin
MINKSNTIIVAAILLAIIGFGFQYFFKSNDNTKASIQPLFAATFPNENGKPQSLKQYAGKIIVLNFWATWCEPCREEMPELSALHDAYKNKNVVVLGVAVDEVAAISQFTKETKVSYPLFAADMQGMEIANHLGNDKSVLPYTVIIKADGSVAKTYFGRVTKPLLEQTLTKLLN